jgi:hypothetical protein
MYASPMSCPAAKPSGTVMVMCIQIIMHCTRYMLDCHMWPAVTADSALGVAKGLVWNRFVSSFGM